jgi:nitroimidazol reductase NimA-like FMN-containing flavoprotein (pyridoxamine 5'-phosphate oxidase superfamily)
MSTMMEGSVMTDDLPVDVIEVFERTITCEFATMSKKDDRPVATPMTHLWRGDLGQFVLSSSLVVPNKLYRLRQDPRVSLTFTHFAGSGLADPSPVLVQGDATVDDRVFGAEGMEDFWREMFRKKESWQDLDFSPDKGAVSTRIRMLWRARITVQPRMIWVLRGSTGTQELERVR